MTIAVDSNVLVYALDRAGGDKHDIAREVMLRGLDADLIIPAQVLAEFINVVRRKQASAYPEAVAQAEEWHTTFLIVDTTAADVLNAARFAGKHKLQLWDGLVWQIARRGGAEWLLTEDLQDGLGLEGLTALNPFQAANRAKLDELLQPRG